MAKKALLLLIVAFAVFYVLARPEGAADSTQGAVGAVGHGFEQLAKFVSALIA